MPRKPIRSRTTKVDEPKAIYALYKEKAVFHSNLASATYFLPGKFFKCLWEGKKNCFQGFFYPGIAGSIPGPNGSIMGASTKIPVLFTEQKELNPYSPHLP